MAFLAIEATNIITDQSSLLALKVHITHDPNNFLPNNWTATTSVCNWVGITCDSQNNIIIVESYLNESYGHHSTTNWKSFIPCSTASQKQQLSGNLPEDMGQYLPVLQRLILHHNQLEGPIPSSLGQCRELLRISLDGNKFTGTIPRNVGNLSLLQELYLDTNNLRGELPEELGDEERQLLIFSEGDLEDKVISRISGNSSMESDHLSGLVLISVEGFDQQKRRLSVDLAQKSGSKDRGLSVVSPGILKRCGRKSMVSLKVLLKGFEISGPFITQTGGIPGVQGPQHMGEELEVVFVQPNNTAGIPRFNLQYSLMAKNNSLIVIITALLVQSWIFSFVMAAATNITTDQHILLALKDHITYDPSNLLAKNWSTDTSICTWIGVTCGVHHHRVTVLNISYFGLAGTIPPQLGNLSFLQSLDIRNNSFSGSLPDELAQLRRLKYINFMFNSFHIEIPPWFGSSSKLQHLFLNNNNLVGTIPLSLGNLSSLRVVDLSYNQLSGTIPSSIFQISSLETLNLSYNQLSDSFPSIIFNLPSLQVIDFSSNSLSGGLLLRAEVCDLVVGL
ncbi:hypothetical protein EZV62_026909 [Acer yangbiense]|uniref:Leucine-rich repeat-containing N-terminal plant-type domain-containing protein n=1 Tax=Acer yangbiense TaxID=1000413 RepID=A0A5C7GSQ7_9ROSI|nr:hypothetical protein EZV62_026909 [Acer yangbiense]